MSRHLDGRRDDRRDAARRGLRRELAKSLETATLAYPPGELRAAALDAIVRTARLADRIDAQIRRSGKV